MTDPQKRILCKDCVHYRSCGANEGECHVRSMPDVLRLVIGGTHSRDSGWPRRKPGDFCGEAVARA